MNFDGSNPHVTQLLNIPPQHQQNGVTNNPFTTGSIAIVESEPSVQQHQQTQTLVPPVSMQLAVGSIFQNWENVDEFLDQYGREQGFVVRKKRVERDELGIVRKRTYDCEHGGRYTPKKKAALHEQRNRTSKRIQCNWHINLSFPKTSAHITVTTFVNEHNHELHYLHRSLNDIRNSGNSITTSSSSTNNNTSNIPHDTKYQMVTTATSTINNASTITNNINNIINNNNNNNNNNSNTNNLNYNHIPHNTSPRSRSVVEAASTTSTTKNRTLPKAVLEDIEFYTRHGNLGVTTQRQLLKAKYPNHQLPARDVANAVQRIKGGTEKSADNDAAKLWIWELARKATQIALDQQDNKLEDLLRQYIREKEDRVRSEIIQQ
ncbi:10013_t:CDS:1 [Ambispora leptoticha]|uniref:10013_t:CDS:1 n=1 Tax=Ambispora leptoticha TaxID=144679 RepID=A0A9N8VFW5_9GLOM|nr:10013_t:CDS:1 [Ambispora leptoticha]